MITATCFAQYGLHPYRNMAIDEWLFAQAMARPGMVALRLYSWQPGGITFGFNQRLERAVAHERLGPTPLIRRVTGGRALYHDPSEITYAVVVNAEGLPPGRLSGTLAQSSAAIAEALTAFLQRLGVKSQYLRHTVQADHRPAFFHSAPCFASAARHEIISGAQKVVASAQRRLGSTMLQHGSIKLGGVAYHPALDGPECPHDRESACDPLPAQHFHELQQQFFATMGDVLGLDCEDRGWGEAEERTIAAWEAQVERNSLGKRDIIKHVGVDGSP